MIKLLGRYSQQQGTFAKVRGRLTNISADTWGFLQLQFSTSDLFLETECGTSTRVRIYRVTESGLVVKAAQINRSCAVMRFETITQLHRLCNVFGESVTAGQRCHLPKIASPKSLGKNDLINVVCGSDSAEQFIPRTVRDGINLEYDGSSELFITIRYRRYAYTSNLAGCDPLLSSVIRWCNPYAFGHDALEVGGTTGEDESTTVMYGSEFEDFDGRLYRVTHMDATRVFATCFYPRCSSNELLSCEKAFDLPVAKDLIAHRLNG
jgi:hypothetical protein